MIDQSRSTGTPFGEILESSLTQATCTIWERDSFPAYGSLVAIDGTDHILYGIITQSASGPRDATRTPHPYKKTEAELKRDHPHIFEFITSWCTLIFIAHQRNNQIMYTTPPIPAKIHAFARSITYDEATRIFASPQYVHRLFNAADQNIASDELLVALLKEYPLAREHYEALTHELMLIMGADYRRLKILLSRLL